MYKLTESNFIFVFSHLKKTLKTEQGNSQTIYLLVCNTITADLKSVFKIHSLSTTSTPSYSPPRWPSTSILI